MISVSVFLMPGFISGFMLSDLLSDLLLSDLLLSDLMFSGNAVCICPVAVRSHGSDGQCR